jgi:hypothetical protein
MRYGKKALEDLYSGVAGKPVQPRKHLNILGEEVDLYTKRDNEYSHVGEVSDENFAKINRIATGGDALELINQYLESKHYSQDSFRNEYDYDSLIDILDRGEFEKYIASADKPTLSLNQLGNVIDLVTSKGFDERTARRASMFKPVDSNGSNIGPCEILLALTFDNVTNSTSGGDLMMGGEKLEVKGQGGRFGQQGGRGGPALSLAPLVDGLEQDKIPMMVASLETNIINTYKAFVESGQEDRFLPNLHNLLTQAYPGGDAAKYFTKDINYLEPSRRGQPLSQIRKHLAKLNLQQYAAKYGLKNLIFVKGPPQKGATHGYLGDFVTFTVDEAIKDGGLIDRGMLHPEAFSTAGLYPNFSYKFEGKS